LLAINIFLIFTFTHKSILLSCRPQGAVARLRARPGSDRLQDPYVRLRPVRPAHHRGARPAVSRPDAPLSRRRTEGRRVPPAAPAEWPLHPALRPHAAYRRALWSAVFHAGA